MGAIPDYSTISRFRTLRGHLCDETHHGRAPAALYAFPVAVVRVPGAVQLMQTSPAALSPCSWPHEHRSAA